MVKHNLSIIYCLCDIIKYIKRNLWWYVEKFSILSNA